MTDFEKPLDTDILEEQEVEHNEIVPTGRNSDGSVRFDFKTVKEKVEIKTRYTRAEPHLVSCKNGTHHWQILDPHKHIAACSVCPKRRFLRAIYEFIDSEGHLRDRDTKTLID